MTGGGHVDPLVHLEPRVSDVDAHPGSERHLPRHAPAVDEGAVARTGVLELGAALVDIDPGVRARHARVLEPEFAGGGTPDHERAIEWHSLASGQYEVEVAAAVARGATGPTAGVGPADLPAAHLTQHRDE